MHKKYFIIGVIIILVIAGITAGKIFYDKSKIVYLPAEEITVDDSGEDNVTEEHVYRD